MTKEIIWTPSEEIIKKSKLTSFIKYCNLKNYDDLESKAFQNPGWLWDSVIKFSDLKFYENYKKIMDDSKGAPWTKWCVGGKTNIVLNCIDRHKDKELLAVGLVGDWASNWPNEPEELQKALDQLLFETK